LGANYGRGLFKQLQETIEQVEKLTAEIREIKSAHQVETASLKTEIESLRKENTALKAENQKLKAIINKDKQAPVFRRLQEDIQQPRKIRQKARRANGPSGQRSGSV